MLDTLSSISEINTCGIVTRSSSAFNSDFVDLGTHNCAAQSSVFYYEKSKDELFFQWLKNIAPDYIFVSVNTFFRDNPDILVWQLDIIHLSSPEMVVIRYLGSAQACSKQALPSFLWIMRLTLVQSYLNQK